MARRLLLFDDEPMRSGSWQRSLSSLEPLQVGWDIVALDPNDFKDAIDALEGRRLAARTGTGPPSESTPFDGCDVVVLDYDLIQLGPGYGSVTGENVAYLCRSYSDAKFIITLNEFGELDFDLTLKPHLESHADLLLNDAFLAEPSLWGGAQSGFRPWHWPDIPIEVERFKRRVEDVLVNLDASVLDFFGLSESALSKSATSFLGQARTGAATFRTFAEASGNGFRHQDRPTNDEAIARVAAARISQWLSREVLGGQDVLVDSPHLASRLPSLLGSDRSDLGRWNGTCAFPGAASEPGLDESHVGANRFPSSHWLSRPAWYWAKINNDEAIPEVADPWSVAPAEFVFCEDLSLFVERMYARPFLADLASPFVRRYVADIESLGSRIPGLDSIEYRPADRLEAH